MLTQELLKRCLGSLKMPLRIVLFNARQKVKFLRENLYPSSGKRVGDFRPLLNYGLLLFCRCGHVGNALALSTMSNSDEVISSRVFVIGPWPGDIIGLDRGASRTMAQILSSR
jgi:hypothetical protein